MERIRKEKSIGIVAAANAPIANAAMGMIGMYLNNKVLPDCVGLFEYRAAQAYRESLDVCRRTFFCDCFLSVL